MADAWSIIEAVGSAAGAGVGALVLGVAVYQLRLLRKQIGDAARGVEAARQSADAAKEATREASKARADATAPRIIVEVQEIVWPPLLDRTRSGMPYGNELRLLDAQSLHQGQQVDTGVSFVFDRDRGYLLWFQARGVLHNEGAGSARVRLDAEAHLDGHNQWDEVLVRPGDTRSFVWGTGLTLADWADLHGRAVRGRNTLTVTVLDFQEHGTIDHVYLELGGQPIEPEPGVQSGWRIAENNMAVTVYPIRRTYRWEWPDNRRRTPWEDEHE